VFAKTDDGNIVFFLATLSTKPPADNVIIDVTHQAALGA
jgi:hypothetical protein